MKVILANLGSEPFEVRRGERIAQLVPAPVLKAEFAEVDELDETQRGGRGLRHAPGRVSLTDAELDRYARHIVLPQVGGVGQNKLKAASVAVIGAGGIGSAVDPGAGRRPGVGRLTIIDDDMVDARNLQRQPIFRDDQVGGGKAELRGRVRRGAQSASSRPSPRSRADRCATMRAELLGGHDLVLDGSDNFATRLAVSDACVALGIPLVSAAADPVPGAGRAVRGAALLPLLRRRRVRQRGLRQLRGAWRARRADRDGRRVRGADGDPRHRRDGRGSAGKLHLVRRRDG